MVKNEKTIAVTKTVKIQKTATEKMVRVHMLILTGVCLAFGGIAMPLGQIFTGISAFSIGILMPIVVILMKNTSTTARGRFLAVVQCFTVPFCSIPNGEFHHLLPLLVASTAMVGIYFDKTSLIVHWILSDIVMIGALFFRDYAYGGEGIDFLIKVILGINVATAIIFYLVSCAIKFLDSAHDAHEETDRLLAQVRIGVKGKTAALFNTGEELASNMSITRKDIE